MWYEICIPGAAIVLFTSMPALILPIYRKLWYGNSYNKYTEDKWVECFWFRDHHLTGNPFKPNDIDTLPDQPPEQFRKKE